MLRWQKGAVDGSMRILSEQRRNLGGKTVLTSCVAAMETEVAFVVAYTPPQGHDLPGPRLAVLPPSSSIFLAACLKYWQRGKQIISRLYFAILKEFTLRMKHQPVKNNKLLQQRRRAFLLSAFSFNKLLWLFKFSLSSQKPSFRWVTSAYKLNERIWESTHFRKVIFKQPLVEAKLTMFPYLELIFFREAQIHWAAGLLNWRWMVIV